jgi:hypothetical protein
VRTAEPQHEAPQARGEGASDAYTFSFADPGARLYGFARLGVVPGDPPVRSGIGLLFAGTEPVAVAAEGASAAEAPAGVRAEVVEPLRRWRIAFGDAFDLTVEALTPPVTIAADDPVAKAGGMQGYEQLCRFRGTAGGRRIDCLGQRGHAWGVQDWAKIALTRSIAAWLDTETAVTIAGVRPAKAKHHADEHLTATIVLDGAPVPVEEPLVSTTFDGAGRQRHVGLELWLAGEEHDGYPHRAAGEVVCGTTLELGRLRLDTAFVAWHMEGRTGVGRYDIWRREA